MELRERSIPTCVGNAPGAMEPAVRLTVHPHVRGERDPSQIVSSARYGPSPRAWGTRWRHEPRRGPRRSIPTCVGNATPRLPRASGGSVHPHVRGERTSSARQK